VVTGRRAVDEARPQNSEGETHYTFIVTAKGERLGARLTALAVRTKRVRDARGRGLMWGVELAEAAAPIVAAARERQLLIASAGPNVLRLVPPLIVTEEEIDRAADTLGEILT